METAFIEMEWFRVRGAKLIRTLVGNPASRVTPRLAQSLMLLIYVLILYEQFLPESQS